MELSGYYQDRLRELLRASIRHFNENHGVMEPGQACRIYEDDVIAAMVNAAEHLARKIAAERVTEWQASIRTGRAEEAHEEQELREVMAEVVRLRRERLRRVHSDAPDHPWPEAGHMVRGGVVGSALRKRLISKSRPRACRLCAIDLPYSELVLDHCHRARVTRGFICQRCNVLLGVLENERGAIRDVDWIACADRYLKTTAIVLCGVA